MPNCAVPGCPNRTDRKITKKKEEGTNTVSFHKFPLNSSLRDEWQKAIGREAWEPSKTSSVCSNHFAAACFKEIESSQKTMLIPGSIPTIFDLKKNKENTKLQCNEEQQEMEPLKNKRATPLEIEKTNKGNAPKILVKINMSNFTPSNKVFLKHEVLDKRQLSNHGSSNPSYSSKKPKITHECPDSRENLTDATASDLKNSQKANSLVLEDSENTPATKELSEIEEILPSEQILSEKSKNCLSLSSIFESFQAKELSLDHAEKPTIKINTSNFTSSSRIIIRNKIRDKGSSIKYNLPSRRILSEKNLREKILALNKRKREAKRRERLLQMKEKGAEENTPRKARLKKNLKSKDRVIKTLRESIYRKSKKIATMETIIKELKERRLMSSDDLEILKSIGGPNKEFLDRQISAKKNAKMKRQYGEHLRTFALTLHYKSPAAYSYVRRVFNLALPHPVTIYKWYKVIDGKPGFTTESFRALKEKYLQTSEPIYASLLIDEMSIRKQIETDGKVFFGFVDFGAELDNDNSEEAKDALVIMLVAINGSWKLPLGYFLTNGTTGIQKANLIKTCLHLLLEETKVRVVSLTADGACTNITMFKELGCQLEDLNKLKTWFLHPTTEKRIFVFLDSCHMIKLIRNTLGEKHVLYNETGAAIEWKYIKALYELQETEGLHLANKISSKHIFFYRNKMKVALATQVLSSSVAISLQILIDKKIESFLGAHATIEFIQIFNTLFDIFNSKNLAQIDFKKPLSLKNFEKIKDFLVKSETYIKCLKCDTIGTPITSSTRKTGFLGFLINIKSLIELFHELCIPNLLTFIPTYKLCQDHLEMFFGLIRMRGGLNNNPSARQFISAYKKCLVHLELRSGRNGNCIPMENISILTCTSKLPEKVINASTPDCDTNHDFDTDNPDDPVNTFDDEVDHMYSFCPTELTALVEDIISYISGFIVRRLSKQLRCSVCIAALAENPTTQYCHLITLKNKGGLIVPSQDVVSIVRYCEKMIRVSYYKSNSFSMPASKTPEIITNDVMKLLLETNTYNKLFSALAIHSVDQEAMFDHKYHLIKSIALRYVMVRIHHICKQAIETSNSKRQVYNKLLLFQGQ